MYGISNQLYNSIYAKDNYLVEHSASNNSVCAVYFSSSGIYHPANDVTFSEAFVYRDKYEWYKNRYPGASKHIFVRDIAKLFYIYGINERVSSMDALIDLLRELTEGYEIVVIGSSGGGYAATVVGMMLKAKVVYCFSGFFDLTLVSKGKWPILAEPFTIQKYGKWYRIKDIPENQKNSCKVVYCFPNKSKEDVEQYYAVKDHPSFIFFGIANRIHGVSIGAYNLETFFSTEIEYLQAIASPNLTLAEFTYRINKKDNLFKAYKDAELFYWKRLWNGFQNRLIRLCGKDVKGD